MLYMYIVLSGTHSGLLTECTCHNAYAGIGTHEYNLFITWESAIL